MLYFTAIVVNHAIESPALLSKSLPIPEMCVLIWFKGLLYIRFTYATEFLTATNTTLENAIDYIDWQYHAELSTIFHSIIIYHVYYI